jgi:RNA polymerase sigma-70 factor (ECF subfamily)
MSELAALLKAARNLDKDALTGIFDLFSPALYKFVSRFVYDPTLVDGLVADVFGQLIEEFAAGRGPRANLRPYLYQSTYRLMVERLQAVHPLASLELVTGTDQTDNPVRTQPQNDEPVTAQVLLSTMNTELSADQRLVIILRFLEDFSVKETAEIIGKDANNVKVIQSRGLARLKKVLSLEPDEDPTVLLRF